LKTVLWLLLLVLFAGCSTRATPHYTQKTKTLKKYTPPYKPKTNNYITKALYKQYKKWYKVPYKYGGCNKCGLDCSALVQNIYKDAFGIQIPRTTKNQAKVGYRVQKNSTKAGDLVFFHTGYNSRHVGIIIEKDKFIHTSTKRGVTISSVNNPYWKSRYWQSRRILP